MLCYTYFDNVNLYYEEVTIYASIARQVLLLYSHGDNKNLKLRQSRFISFRILQKKENPFTNESRIKIADQNKIMEICLCYTFNALSYWRIAALLAHKYIYQMPTMYYSKTNSLKS